MFSSIRLNDREAEEEDTFENAKSGLKTLNLRLDEVAHIRAALTKAELEGIDGNLRNDIERGKVSNVLTVNLNRKQLRKGIEL